MAKPIQDISEKDRICIKLFELATPELYRQNAFRVLGLPVNATMRDIKRRQTKLKMKERLGMNSADEHYGYLSLNPPPEKDDIAKAVQRLQDPEDRLLDELFWFWPRELGSPDDDGLELLANNHLSKAISLWSKYEERGTVSKVSTHNLAVLYHAIALDLEREATKRALKEKEMGMYRLYWKRAYRRWERLFDDESFWSRLTARIRMLNDPRLTTGTARRIRKCLPKTLLLVNARLALHAAENGKKKKIQRHIMLMQKSGLGQGLVNEALLDSLSNIRQRLKIIYSLVETKSTENPKKADKVASQLIKDVKPLLLIIDQLLPENDIVNRSVHNQIATSVIRCQIEYGVSTKDWKTSLKLLETALPLAGSESVRLNIQENIKIVSDNIKYMTCFFCERNPGDDSATVEVAMHGDVNQDYFQNRITWNHTKVKVPRCSKCMSYHKMISNWKTAWAIGGGIIGGVIGLIITRVSEFPCAIFLMPIILAAIGALIGSVVAKSKIPYDIKPLKDNTKFHGVKELLSQNWGFGESPSQQ